jgi:IS5 family transposase
MFRLDYEEFSENDTLFDLLIPPKARKLHPLLEKIDMILQDETLEEPFLKAPHSPYGRGEVPLRPYIRLMVLKEIFQYGYETLVEDVSTNLSLKKFCRIPMEKEVPDSTTLIKLTHKYGDDIVKELNNKLAVKLSKKNSKSARRLRIDTTVVESNIHYPTDSGLMMDCVNKIKKIVGSISETAGEITQDFRSKTRTVKNKLLTIAKTLKRRSGDSKEEVRKITSEMADIVEEAVKGAERVLKRASQNPLKVDAQLTDKLTDIVETAKKIVHQSREVMSGNTSLKDRLISIHDQDARPIKKGKLGKKVEFGYKLLLAENGSGFITDYKLYKGNPTDDSLLPDTIKNHIDLFGKSPKTVSADRGFGTKENEEYLTSVGVKNICIPRRGKKSKARMETEKGAIFRKYQRWRAGIEGRISYLKRCFGLARLCVRGYSASKTKVGWAIFVHNLSKAMKIA